MGLFAAYVVAYCPFYGPTQEEMEAASTKREAERLAQREAERAKEDALATVVLAPKGDVRSENREPSKAELERKQRLDRKRR